MNGTMVRSIRIHHGLDQATFARKVGVKQSTLSAVECGTRLVSSNLEVRIAQAFPLTDEVLASIQNAQTLKRLESI